MIWTWFGHDLDMIWTWFGHHLSIIWSSFGHHLDIIWASFGHHLGIIWTSLAVVWASPVIPCPMRPHYFPAVFPASLYHLESMEHECDTCSSGNCNNAAFFAIGDTCHVGTQTNCPADRLALNYDEVEAFNLQRLVGSWEPIDDLKSRDVVKVQESFVNATVGCRFTRRRVQLDVFFASMQMAMPRFDSLTWQPCIHASAIAGLFRLTFPN